MELPAEIWEAILLDTDVEDLPSVCFQHSTIYKVCNHPQFWKRIFEREKLPLIRPGTNFGQWFREYQYLKEIPSRVEDILRGPEFKIEISRDILQEIRGGSVIISWIWLSAYKNDRKILLGKRIYHAIPGISTQYYYCIAKKKSRYLSEDDVRQILKVALLHKPT